jgi:hypothetical protein
MDSVYKKLHDNFCAIPRCYIKFCMDIVKELKEGEDFNIIENFIEDLVNFNDNAITNFCHSGIDENIIDKLSETLFIYLTAEEELGEEPCFNPEEQELGEV